MTLNYLIIYIYQGQTEERRAAARRDIHRRLTLTRTRTRTRTLILTRTRTLILTLTRTITLTLTRRARASRVALLPLGCAGVRARRLRPRVARAPMCWRSTPNGRRATPRAARSNVVPARGRRRSRRHRGAPAYPCAPEGVITHRTERVNTSTHKFSH